MNKETELRTISGFPDYFVNNIGEIWSKKGYNKNLRNGMRKLKIYPNKKGYYHVTLCKNGEKHEKRVSRIVLNAQPGVMVDHEDQNKSNNKRANLRVCTQSQNQGNMFISQGTSQYKGVFRNKTKKRWIATMSNDGKTRYLGSFVSEKNAAKAYNEAASEYFGEFARLNHV